MTMEWAVETRRLKLLRLLAGWLAAVGFLSVAPLAPAWTRWARGFLASVLSRAEAAAQCLVFIQAREIARKSGGDVDRAWLVRHVDLPSACALDAPPSLATLRRRIIALRRVLKTLPRHAMRLLRRMAAGCDGHERREQVETARAVGLIRAGQCHPLRVWHPPESRLLLRIFYLPPASGRRVLAWLF